MFIRKNKNRSGSYSIQIIEKVNRRSRVVKTLGSARTPEQIDKLIQKAKLEMAQIKGQSSLFYSQRDNLAKALISSISNNQISIVGPERVLGKIYDRIGYNILEDDNYFRHLVISRILFPVFRRLDF